MKESKLVNEGDLGQFIPYLKEDKNNILVGINVHSNDAFVLFYSKSVSGRSSGLVQQILTAGISSLIITEQSGDEEVLILNAADSKYVWSLFGSYEHFVAQADQTYWEGDYIGFSIWTEQAQFYQDILAEEYNIKVDAKQEDQLFEEFV